MFYSLKPEYSVVYFIMNFIVSTFHQKKKTKDCPPVMTLQYNKVVEELNEMSFFQKQWQKKMKPTLTFFKENREILETYHGKFSLVESCRSHKSGPIKKIHYVPHGHGIMRSEHLLFEGNFHHGNKRFGRLYNFLTKEIFYGEFREEKMYQGVCTYKNDYRYEGKLNYDSEPHGYGIFHFPDGSYFQGSFQNGHMESGIFLSTKDEFIYEQEQLHLFIKDNDVYHQLSNNFRSKYSIV